jgi:hypothetical protein
MMYAWEDDVERANRVSQDQDAEIAKLRDTVEHYKADAAHDEALIKQLKAALEEIAFNNRVGTITLERSEMIEIASKALANKR